MRNLLFFLLLSVFINSYAQNSLDLDPITLTNSRNPQKLSETGRSITVVDGSLFKQLPVFSIDELLKYVPGVEVQSRGPMGAQSDIVMRGGTFQQVLVLVDGIKLNDPITGHFSSYIPIAPSEIERIEILRGPAAAIYGSEAVGGVINVITKTFNQYKKEKNTVAKVGLALGEFGLINSNAGFNSTGPKINSSIGILSNNASGQLLRGPTRGYLYNHTMSASVAILLKYNWQLSLRSSYDSRDFAAQNFYTTYKSDTATEKVNTWWNQVQLKQQKGKYKQQIDFLYKETYDQYLYNPRSIANENKSKLLMIQYLYSQKLNQQLNLSFGAQLDKRFITSNDRGNHSTQHGAVFGNILFNQNHWKIAPSLRLDLDENYGTALLPQLNIAYQLNKLTLRTNVGKAIRGADFTERFNNYNKTIVSGGSIGNPNLDTENSWSYETGVDLLVSNFLKLSATGFYRDQNNVIDFVNTPYASMPRKDNLVVGSNYALAKNIQKLTTKGIEFEFSYKTKISSDENLLINTGVTFLKSISTESTPSFYIISHARILLQSNLIYACKKFSLATNFIYKKRDAPSASAIDASISRDYFLWNTKVNYKILKKLEIFISINNITNISYSDLLGSRMPGRWSTAGVNFNF